MTLPRCAMSCRHTLHDACDGCCRLCRAYKGLAGLDLIWPSGKWSACDRQVSCLKPPWSEFTHPIKFGKTTASQQRPITQFAVIIMRQFFYRAYNHLMGYCKLCSLLPANNTGNAAGLCTADAKARNITQCRHKRDSPGVCCRAELPPECSCWPPPGLAGAMVTSCNAAEGEAGSCALLLVGCLGCCCCCCLLRGNRLGWPVERAS